MRISGRPEKRLGRLGADEELLATVGSWRDMLREKYF
jgi:hypothetical protein